MLGRFFRFLIFLVVLAVLALIGYAYSGFMTPETQDVTEPVELDDT